MATSVGSEAKGLGTYVACKHHVWSLYLVEYLLISDIFTCLLDIFTEIFRSAGTRMILPLNRFA